MSIFSQDFRFRWNMADHGTPWRLRPMCPRIRRALPTTHYLFDTVHTRWHWESLLDFVQVRLKLRSQGFLSSALFRESSLQTCIGQLDIIVFKYTDLFHLHIVHLLEMNQLLTLTIINGLRRKQQCLHILEACAYFAIRSATMHDYGTHIPYDCILPTKSWLNCQQHIIL